MVGEGGEGGGGGGVGNVDVEEEVVVGGMEAVREKRPEDETKAMVAENRSDGEGGDAPGANVNVTLACSRLTNTKFDTDTPGPKSKVVPGTRLLPVSVTSTEEPCSTLAGENVDTNESGPRHT